MYPLRTNDPRNLLFTDKNAETQLRFVFANSYVQVQIRLYFLSRRHWEQEAASAEEKLKSLTSQLSELRERFNQNQREIEAGNVRFE
jgi:hypothetical protein